MPGVGIGGLISNVLNPGMNDQVARVLTPNPAPLAQQGSGGGTADSVGNPSQPAPPSGANMTPSVAPAPDPVNSQYIGTLLKASQQAAYAADLNRNLEGIAAGFGTAAQQQAKQQALRGEGGGAGDYLGQLKAMQGMQDQTIADNEHARYMGNVTVLAQRLGVTPAEITEMSNTEEGRRQIADVIGGNLTATGTQKDAEAATRAWADAHPEATPKDIADYKANLIAGGMGGSDLEQRQYLGERQAALAAGQKDFPDFLTWKNQHTTQAKEQDATALNIANAKKVLPGVNTAITNMTQIADSVLSRSDLLKGIIADKNKARWANSILKADPKDNTALNAVQTGGLTKEEAAVIGDIAQLHNMNYRGAFSGEGGVKGIRSQVEADRVSRAADQLGNFSVDSDTYIKNLGRLKGTYNSALANASGEAQALEQIPESSRYKLDPSYFSGGANAPPNPPEWAQVKTVSSKADWDKLPNGQAYKAPGSSHGNRILIKGYEDQALSEDDGG